MLKDLKKKVNESTTLLPNARKNILAAIQMTYKILPYLQIIHRTLFFINASTNKLHISKRFTGINYVLIRPFWSINNFIGYKILGYITCIQLLCVLIINVRRLRSKQKAHGIMVDSLKGAIREPFNNDDVNETGHKSEKLCSHKCLLCMEYIDGGQIASTCCGHLFCWKCIFEWLQQKEECPMCRDPIKMSQIILLKNFS